MFVAKYNVLRWASVTALTAGSYKNSVVGLFKMIFRDTCYLKLFYEKMSGISFRYVDNYELMLWI